MNKKLLLDDELDKVSGGDLDKIVIDDIPSQENCVKWTCQFCGTIVYNNNSDVKPSDEGCLINSHHSWTKTIL